MELLRSLAGMSILLLIGFVFSVNKRKISLRTVGAALLLQVLLGAIMLYVPAGKWLINAIASGVNRVIFVQRCGSAFIFGGLVGPKMNELFDGAGFVFAFHVLPRHHLYHLIDFYFILPWGNEVGDQYSWLCLPAAYEYQQGGVLRRSDYHFPGAE
ncbi:Putative pseudouridine transporter [Serratia fonticola]|uniref:Pseudouridine transporter n=1 Tax=Serratia fonticola TaxID=47917 RepID=A0A4U9WEQ1_SERFO|nr:Putative pseudouridine transporter [Serratia fonticola]